MLIKIIIQQRLTAFNTVNMAISCEWEMEFLTAYLWCAVTIIRYYSSGSNYFGVNHILSFNAHADLSILYLFLLSFFSCALQRFGECDENGICFSGVYFYIRTRKI